MIVRFDIQRNGLELGVPDLQYCAFHRVVRLHIENDDALDGSIQWTARHFCDMAPTRGQTGGMERRLGRFHCPIPAQDLQ